MRINLVIIAHQSSIRIMTSAFVDFTSVSLGSNSETDVSVIPVFSLVNVSVCLSAQGMPSLTELTASMVMLMD